MWQKQKQEPEKMLCVVNKSDKEMGMNAKAGNEALRTKVCYKIV